VISLGSSAGNVRQPIVEVLFALYIATVNIGDTRSISTAGSMCYFWAYDNLFSDRTKKVSPIANFYYIFLRIE
jgi:hypothetical protein